MIRPHEDGDLDSRLEQIETTFENGDLPAAWNLVVEGREVYPADPQLRLWEGTLLLENGEAEESLDVFDSLLEEQPDFWPARFERGFALMEFGNFKDALAAFQQTEDEARDELVVAEFADLVFAKAQCLDRLERIEEAEKAFVRAEALTPESFPAPQRLTPDAFQAAVDEALETIDEGLLNHLRQLAIVVKDYPSREQQLEQNPFILGLYVGVPRTERDQESSDNLDHIFVFKRNLETAFPLADELVDQIRITVIHEVAHHFGLGEDAMGEFA